jgi:hypothetical protein
MHISEPDAAPLFRHKGQILHDFRNLQPQVPERQDLG